MPTIDYSQIRQSAVCPGCSGRKDLGCVVCWSCFKRHGGIPFKYWAGDLEAWLKAHGRPSLEEQGLAAQP